MAQEPGTSSLAAVPLGKVGAAVRRLPGFAPGGYASIMTNIRFGALRDYPDLLEFDEFIGDRRLDLQAGELLVAESTGGRAEGYLRISPTGFLGWPLLALLCVRTDVRRRGAGQALVTAAIADGRFPRLYVTTEQGNDAMLELFFKLGAEAIGHVDQLNFDGGRDLLFRLK